MLKLCKINACSDGMLGLHLSRAPWDPYPWVSGVQDTSCAYLAGIRTGDTVLEVNGFDIVGQKIVELAALVRGYWTRGQSEIELLVWRNKTEPNAANQQSLQKFAKCFQSIAQLLECPICLEVVKPPGWQCCNGHVLCNSCRLRTTKCSICRVTLGPRGRCLLADKLFTLLTETFPCNGNNAISPTTQTSCKEPKVIPTSRPIAAIRYIKRKSKQIVTIKVDAEVTESRCRRDESSSVVVTTSAAPANESYHCPTGKSCVNFSSSQVSLPESQSPIPLLLSSEWDVLTHLRRVHQLSVTQHYGTFAERIRVQLMNKSISCISLAPNKESATPVLDISFPSSRTENIAMSCGDIQCPVVLNQILMSAENRREKASVTATATEEESILSKRRTSAAPAGDEVCANATDMANDKISGEELFFVARISIEGGGGQLLTGDGKGATKGVTDDGNGNAAVGNERCAIFIWHCGSEENSKKFQAVIECKRSDTLGGGDGGGDGGMGAIVPATNPTRKWKGFIHPLTKTWNSIRRQKEFLELEFDVANFFDIVIKAK